MPESEYQSQQVAGVFDRYAATYDAARRKMIPCFDGFYGSAIRCLQPPMTTFQTNAPLRVLDLGAGTGLLSARILAAFPQAQMVLVDIAESMLQRARERFAAASVEIQVLDFTKDPLGGPYDVIASALAIHHLNDDGKRYLFARIHAALAPGGVFVNAEQVLGPTPALEEVYKQTWLDDVRRLGASAEEIQASLTRMEQDRCASVEDQLLWLRQAGFTDSDCWFKEGRFAVYSGRKG